MKTGLLDAPHQAAPIVQLTEDAARGTPPADAVARARAFSEPLLSDQLLDTGEPVLAHADAVADILKGIGAAPSMCAAAYLVYAGDYLNKPEEVLRKAFGESQASLVAHTAKLVQIQRAARDAQVGDEARALQTERVRKMLLAFSRDLRVVLLRLASRLQSLRYFAACKRACPAALATETLQVFAPLANRLGIWQIKWELEDLAFRFTEPEQYKQVAGLLDERRVEREQGLAAFSLQFSALLAQAGLQAEVQARPKHLYSIWKKMRGKSLDFEQVFDVRALRVIVADVPACYAVLARVHDQFTVLPGEFDDYIARPKPNGYQSLHTVVLDDQGRTVEVQIRTRDMHDNAEYGVAAHWAYKEAGTRGYAGVSASADFDAALAEARKSVLRQLLAWERDFVEQGGAAAAPQSTAFDDRIYVFTPQATIVELPAGATPIDFAYVVHTDLGHRCRGAKVDGAMVPMNTRLQSGQTIEITAAKEGGPSLDWLNPELGFLQSPRSKAKVRGWFNALALRDTIARGRDAVEKLLQREGKTAIKLDELASRLGFKNADALFEVVGKDEYSLRNIESLLRPAEPVPTADEVIQLRRPSQAPGAVQGGVLVVGVESLLTALARCCRPAPPDVIGGFVTRGKGVAVHRTSCSNFRQMTALNPERRIAVAWGGIPSESAGAYPVDVTVVASDRPGLLRDITEVFAKEKSNVIGMNTLTTKDATGRVARMTFTVEVVDSSRLSQVLAAVSRVEGVRGARRR